MGEVSFKWLMVILSGLMSLAANFMHFQIFKIKKLYIFMQFFEKLCKNSIYNAVFWVNFPAFLENFGNARIILQKFDRKSVKFCIKTHIFGKILKNFQNFP